MSLRLGDAAPDFTAKTTEGEINLYKFLGEGWGYFLILQIILLYVQQN